MPKDTDSVIFSETEREILELALQNPELSNAEIADQTGIRITLVRDTRAQYEDDVELAEGVAESDSGSAAADSVTVDGAELSETQQAILETAAEDPTMMNADIAAETGARITLVRDTLDQYGDAVDTAAGSDDSEDETTATDTVSEPNDTQAAILDLASENPEMTNAEIANQTGARITLVRDTLEEFDGTSGAVGTDTDAASESAAVEANGFSEIQLEILETALENPDLTNGEIADQTGTRITLVRDTIADYQSDDEASTVTDSESDSGSDEIPSEIDTDEFSETQIEILQTALADPELTNGEIADKTGTRLTLVRDTIHEHEYDQKPWDKDLDEEPDDDSEDDETDAETTSTTEEIEMPETTASDLLSDREREILETALENPALTNGEIADQTGARLTLVRDTRATYEEAVDLAEDFEVPDDTEGSQTATASEPTAKQREILDAVEANPDQTNGEIADQTGARLTLVRDTRAQYEDEVDLSGDESVDTETTTSSAETTASSGESADADATDATADQANNGGKVVAALVVVLLLLGLAAAAGII
jgi:DNA-binding CsgD family transcriptional regulator